MGRLDGKVAIVTGSARGTGAEIVRVFTEQGALVTGIDVMDDLGQAVADETGSAFVHGDVRSEADWAAAVASATERHGPVTVLVNNAAILELAEVEDIAAERAIDLLHVNLLGPFLGTKAVVPSMRDAGGGSIVNICSTDALIGMNGVSVYAATKWGLRGLTKSNAVELGRWNIRCNTVCPHGGSEEMSQAWRDEIAERMTAGERFDFSGTPIEPLGRLATLREIASMAMFLATDEASYCTGADFVVDGGHTVGHLHPMSPGGQRPG